MVRLSRIYSGGRVLFTPILILRKSSLREIFASPMYLLRLKRESQTHYSSFRIQRNIPEGALAWNNFFIYIESPFFGHFSADFNKHFGSRHERASVLISEE